MLTVMMCDSTLKELGSGANLWGDKWEERDGLVLFRGKVYVLLDTQLWHEIVEAHHNTPVTGHSGWWKMTELVARNYWWPGMGRYIAKYVKGCDLCNRMKTFPTAPVGKLMPNHIPYHHWQSILVDLITELPQSHGYDSILVAVDYLPKRAHFIATTSDITLLGVAQLFRDSIWKLYGLSEEVTSDRGPQFMLGNDRGTGNTMCFRPGVRWGMGVVLRFDTHTLTITSRGFIAVCIIQGMRLFILKKNKCLVNMISLSILHGMI